MAANKRHGSTAVDRSSPGTQSIETLDAVDDIGHMLHAYRCVEDLLMPVTQDVPRVEVTHQHLHALISALNDALARRIARAKRMALR